MRVQGEIKGLRNAFRNLHRQTTTLISDIIIICNPRSIIRGLQRLDGGLLWVIH